MKKRQISIISLELRKFPYNANFETDDSEMFSEKFCCYLIKISKKLKKRIKLRIFSLEVGSTLADGGLLMNMGYLDDQNKLGFNCIKDVRPAKQISDLKNFIKRTRGILVAYIVKKGKQQKFLFIIIFSKEIFVAFLIFIKSISMNMDSDVYRPSFEVHQFCITESNNLEFQQSLKSFKSTYPTLDLILKLNGGDDDLDNLKELQDLVNLVKNIIAKSPNSSFRQISINKILKKVLELIEPVITNKGFWRLMAEFEKPGKLELSLPSKDRSTDSSNIFAEAFPVNKNFGRPHPFGPPKIRRQPDHVPWLGNPNLPAGPRSFKEINTYLDAKKGGGQSSAPKFNFNMDEQYENFMRDIVNKGLKLECSKERFVDLALDPKKKIIDDNSLFEAKGCLQAEALGRYKNLRRPTNPKIDLDYEANSIQTGDRIYVDHKGPIHFSSLEEKGINITGFPSHEQVAYNIGKYLLKQKNNFLNSKGFNDGPESPTEVLHVINLDNMKNPIEKEALVNATLKGAKDAGYDDIDIHDNLTFFINDK